ncbi:hypothetical protein TEA_004894 [Camellia sinensis var. sinensis]|uniref:Uncharacterized protein n=1 Tax=Camellia sinensis var. sinensis TaxID=542762 RepID=A0A4S4DKU4_CAMSN|nr:hypothetical protein TEA_004894 [Camellia sinensis var. sinensis]
MSTDPSPVDVSADLSPVDASPSLQTADIGSSVKRVRGPTRGKNTSRLITQHGGKKLFVGVLLSGEHLWGLMPLRRLMNWGHKFDFKPHCKEQKIGRTFTAWSNPANTSKAAFRIQFLGKRSGYLKGFGVGPKPSSAFNSRARSQVRDEEVKGLKEEVALLKGIIQSYEGCFEQFEHFMRQMQGNHSGYDSFDERGCLGYKTEAEAEADESETSERSESLSLQILKHPETNPSLKNSASAERETVEHFVAILSPTLPNITTIRFSMADDVPQGGAPSVILEGGVPLADLKAPILLRAADVEDPRLEDADIVTGDILADITTEEI